MSEERIVKQSVRVRNSKGEYEKQELKMKIAPLPAKKGKPGVVPKGTMGEEITETTPAKPAEPTSKTPAK